MIGKNPRLMANRVRPEKVKIQVLLKLALDRTNFR
jgi:hypothetical protein